MADVSVKIGHLHVKLRVLLQFASPARKLGYALLFAYAIAVDATSAGCA